MRDYTDSRIILDSASGSTPGPKSAAKSTKKLEIVLPAKAKSAKPMDPKGSWST